LAGNLHAEMLFIYLNCNIQTNQSTPYILYVFLDMLKEARAVKISFSCKIGFGLGYVIVLQGHFDSGGGAASFTLPAILQEDIFLFDFFVRPSTWLILQYSVRPQLMPCRIRVVWCVALLYRRFGRTLCLRFRRFKRLTP
jgi:hypothetical protein